MIYDACFCIARCVIYIRGRRATILRKVSDRQTAAQAAPYIVALSLENAIVTGTRRRQKRSFPTSI